MDCRECRSLLSDLRAGRLTPAGRERMREHLGECAACRERFAATGGDEAILSASESEDLTRGILARTSGSPCERAHALLPATVDGETTGTDSELLRSHLEHCGECAALLEAMAWTSGLLPEMAELEPGADFTAGVLAATSDAHRAPATAGWLERLRGRWMERLRERWLGAWRRPRFALEGAYIGTLVLIALFGTPLSPIQDAPTRALETLRAGPGALVTALAPELQVAHFTAAGWGQALWNRSGVHVLRATAAVGEVLGARGRRAAPAAAELRGDAGALIEAVGRFDLQAIEDRLSEMGGDIGEVWRGLFGKGPAPVEIEDRAGRADAP